MDPKILYTIIGIVITGLFAGLIKLVPVIVRAARSNGQQRTQQQPTTYAPSRTRCVNFPEIKQALMNNQLSLLASERTEKHIELIKTHAVKQTGIEEQMLASLKEIAQNGKT